MSLKVKSEEYHDGVGLTWDDTGLPLSKREGQAWWAGWDEGRKDGEIDTRVELADEIEWLREALRRVRTAIFDAKPEVLTDTLWMHDRLGETVVDCIDHALNDYDWEVRERAALGENE